MNLDSQPQALMNFLCRYLNDHAQEPVTLEKLCEVAGYGADHLQKVFLDVTGVSPKQYHRRQRAPILKSALRREAPLSQTVDSAGNGSPSYGYGHLALILGMSPGEYKKQGLGTPIHFAEAPTRLGWMGLGATHRGICFLQFSDERPWLRLALEAEFGLAAVEPVPDHAQPEVQRWLEVIDASLAGKKRLAELPLDLRGSAFQISVWTFLQTIPPGQVRSYGQVAQALGQPSAVRAVATACGSNRIALLVPCHRVIRGDGRLGGYKWGLERKEFLLNQEKSRDDQ